MYKESPTCCLLTTVKLVCPIYRVNGACRLILPKDIGLGDSSLFLGVRDCLCMTLTCPKPISSIYLISKHIPSITWLGPVFLDHHYTPYDIVYRIPPKVWCPQSGPYTGIITSRAYGYSFTDTKTNRSYTILFFPALNRSGVVQAEYLI
jgi:hypothetical protein